MKKIIKTGLIIIGLLLTLIVIGVSYINIKGIPSYDPPTISDYSVTPTPEKVARGRKLGSTLCAGCHMNPDTRKLTGKHMSDAPPDFGFIYSPNITQDKDYGIGEWTDAEIMYLLRTGIKRDGKYAPPYMAKLPHLADDDMEAIIAWLRSDDPMVVAASVPAKPIEPSFLTKFLSNVVLSPLPHSTEKIPMPDTTNQVELGKYYAINFECFSCHSADFKTINFMEPSKTPGFLGGGNLMLTLEGEEILTSNITPHKEFGIGNWTKEQFIKAVKSGVMKDEEALRYPMIPYTQLTDYEAGAIYEYLMTVEPLANDIKRSGIE